MFALIFPDFLLVIRRHHSLLHFRYHVPRSWVHSGENLLVLHEEIGGDPSKISILTRTDQEICSLVSEFDPPAVDSWKPNSEVMSAIPEVRLSCEQGRHVSSINFASFGTPTGQCGKLSHGLCYAQNVLQIVQEVRISLTR
ncbi:hypothetical protein IFM89_003879 [Coptis chinensis]|uniref:Uncharacterized protein n=1 Tax=Coptis chinensis TaxID=261450 RepID=A0A835LYM3_9MAGN|nr:hypothetical protein IFM89_003879 [Coptis chinensis]